MGIVQFLKKCLLKTMSWLLGFDNWFCLFAAVCSAVAAVQVCVDALHELCACYASAMCVGQIHKRG